LYVRYIECYKKLEDSYDQMINPQKRMLLKELLDNTILRMIQVKKVSKHLWKLEVFLCNFCDYS
jgi:hypothetical protein